MTEQETNAVTAKMDGSFVVFIIGMRVNRPWKFWKWLPVMASMPKMIAELSREKERGFLSAESWLGRNIVSVQYWKSVEDLLAYAHNKNAEHLPAWKEFNRRIKDNGDVGIYHETYKVEAGAYECVYRNMGPFGLARAGIGLEAGGELRTAAGRLKIK